MAANESRVVRFGVFEVDLSSGELRKSGVKVRLQEQPFQVLKALIERPGEVVTREELQRRLWPDETFVDFEDGLSTAVRKIRLALGDSASNPRFVETLPKRGYRFVGPLRSHAKPEGQAPARARPSWSVFAGLLAVVAVAGALWSVFRDRPEKPVVWRPVPLTTAPGVERTPDFSPDGTQMVYAADHADGSNLDLYIRSIGPGEPVQLTAGPGNDFGPAWSPDGRWIAFNRSKGSGGRKQTILVPALGGRERVLAESAFLSYQIWPFIAWTANSKWIITDDRQSELTSGGGLWFISIETGEKIRLTGSGDEAEERVSDVCPSVSPDGKWVAFSRNSGDGRAYNIYKLRLSDQPAGRGEPIRLTGTVSNALRFGSRWSPDGSSVIYAEAYGAAIEGLWSVASSGAEEPKPLDLEGFNPAISASSNRLVYEQRNRDADIWRIPLDRPGRASGPPERWIASTRGDGGPAYSPGGGRITFGSRRSGFPEIWIANSDGSQPTQITNRSGGQTGTSRWSPDGRRLLFNSMDADGNREVFTVEAEGGRVTPITNHPANDYLPNWSHDGRWIYFTSNRSGIAEVWKIPFDGGEALQVTHGGGVSGYESSDGAFHYFWRDRSLWRVPTTGGPAEPIQGSPELETHRWALVDSGIYFTLPREILYFDFASAKANSVVRFDGTEVIGPGISPSRDGKYLLVSLSTRNEIDLMLVEDFR